jgi:DNA-binding MurR/RpiR family transcriptional regulator
VPVLSKTYVERIRDSQSEFSPSFALLANYLLDSYAYAALLTATEIGHKLDIDTATVVRFAQHIGYTGFPELQREIRDRLRQELLLEDHAEPDSSTEAVDSALKQLAHGLELTRRSFPFDEAESLVLALDSAQRIILIAEGLALPAAKTLAAWFESTGYNIHFSGGSLSDLARALAGSRKGDLVFVIEVDDETPFLSAVVSEAKAAGIRTAAVVATPSSPAARHADIVLSAFQTSEPGARQIMVEALIYAFLRLLQRVRPGRFRGIDERVEKVRTRLREDNGL